MFSLFKNTSVIRKNTRKPRIWTLLCALVFLLTGLFCFNQQIPAQSQPIPPVILSQQASTESDVASSPQGQGLTEPQDLEAFLDDFFEEQMAELHIPGVVISLVKNGDLFFTKGYGYADVEKQIPVSPEQTLFRVGSVSKVLTATAVMQLVDRGLLNLDDDVNQYLKHFQVEQTYPEPITIRNLLTHTSGFSQQYIKVAARNEDEKMSLAEYVETQMPPRVRPPGKLYSYSTYDSDLAGYLVEVVSGVPFPQYIEENILKPLQMNRSTFDQPLPSPLASDVAVGYEYEDDTYEAFPFLYLNAVPAAAMSATATDIAHFMLAHLQDGRYGNERILSEASAQAMRQQQFTDHPKLPGIGYAFHERFKNQQRVLAHSAIFKGYTGLLSLIPEQNLGIFIAYNKFEPKLHERLTNQFLDRYYPVAQEPEVPQPPADFQQRDHLFTGTYRDIEYPEHTLTKVTSLFGHVSVRKGDNGTLTVNFPEGFFTVIPPQETLTKLVEVEPLLFYRLNDDDYVAFEADERGRITYMYHPLDLGPAGFEKLPGYETTYFQVPLIAFFLVLFLSACCLWPGNYLIRRFQKKQVHKNHLARQAWLVAGLVSTLNLLFPIALGLAFWQIGPLEFIYGLPTVVSALLYLPLIAIGITVSLPIFTVLAWKNKDWSVRERVHYSLVTLAALGFIPFLYYWNLLGSQL